ncbi:hypothetical protein QRX64_32705, partial [Pseudomonas aeruginosa]|uniref:hypothetical protein n=1 Tax=Pseudomonas aeruginosa TaxID=287 RepID=UPI002B23D0A9
MGSCAAPSAKGDDKFITTDYLQQCRLLRYQVSWGYVSCICSWIRLDTEAVHRFAVFVADPRHN